MLLLHSPPSDPLNILNRFIEPLSDDLNHELVSKYGIDNPTEYEENQLCYFLLDQVLARHSKHLSDVGLDGLVCDSDLWEQFMSNSHKDLLSVCEHAWQFLEMLDRLNQRQKIIMETVVELTNRLEAGLMYIDGPGGCGKTFLMNTIIHYLSASNIPVITVTGLMLVNGMTAHSRFKIPLDVNSSTQCNWDHRSSMADIMRSA